MTSVGWPVHGVKPQALPPVKRLFLLPAADLIVTIPPDKEEVRFHQFAFSRALESGRQPVPSPGTWVGGGGTSVARTTRRCR